MSGGPRSNNWKQAHGVEGTRLNEHGDDCTVQSTGSSGPHGSAGVPGEQHKPYDDHEGEDDIE